ncbi:UvrD-helicase domain-containing protein [Candidatus Microgenomates bacterium]|nr:UvrD-helicase domain-containing protein [Candidatus Microgenomates bacterium]
MQADEILKGLNPEQREAVVYNDGPLLIVAGAGTGKTGVITAKIAYLVAEKKAKASEILALTFTKKAAYEMEERVDILLPYGYNDVKIATFHSFAEEFLRENAYSLGFSTNFQLLSDTAQVMFIREHIFDFDLKRYRPLSDPTYFIRDLLKLFSRAKDELITPQSYVDYADKLRIEADNSGDRALIEGAEKQQELARAYATYQQLMLSGGKMDFGDLVFVLIGALKSSPSLLSRLQEKYKYILVDEFQDTNYGQNELLKVLTVVNPNSQKNLQSKIINLQSPIITVVGDDDQSIYKFRGASVSNILDFEKSWPNVKRIVLTKNYRSTQAILDSSYRLIQNNNPDRLEAKYNIEKKITAELGGFGEKPMLFSLDTESDEAMKIAEEISTVFKSQKTPIAYSDFAILVRSNSQAIPFINALSSKKIPFVFSGSEGLFRRNIIKNLIAFLSILVNPNDNLALFNLLVSEIFGVDFDKLSVILHKARSQNIALEEYLRKEKSLTFDAGRIGEILEILDKFRKKSVAKNTGEILYEFLQDSGLLKKLSTEEKAGSIEAGEKIIAIAHFFDRVKSYQDANLDDSIQKFMEYLNLLLEIGEDAKDDTTDPSYEGVRILTMHKAKGLEFDYVFLVGLVEDRVPSRRRSDQLDLPEGLIREILPEGDSHIQEERRLFYVAMTRAKKKLYFSTAKDYGGKRTKKISRFVIEAIGESSIPKEMLKSSAIEKIAQFQPPAEPLYSTSLKIREGKLRLSRAEVDDYLTCPRKYKYIHITPIRLMTDPRVIFGRAVHKVLEEYYKAELALKSQISLPARFAQAPARRAGRSNIKSQKLGAVAPLTIDQLLEIYRQNWSSEGFLSAEHEKQRFDQGIEVIKKFVHSYSKIFNVREVEKKFTFTLDDIIIEGRIDILEEPEKGKIRIVDFKTSNIDSEEKAEKRAKDSIQLAIYALAVEENDGKMPDEVGLFFLESGILGTAIPSEKTIEKTKENIREAARGIRAQNFVATPDQKTCEQCPYSRYCDDSAV